MAGLKFLRTEDQVVGCRALCLCSPPWTLARGPTDPLESCLEDRDP